MNRTSNDGKDIEHTSSGGVQKVDDEPVERGMSGTTVWDKDGTPRDDYGPSSDTPGDRKK